MQGSLQSSAGTDPMCGLVIGNKLLRLGLRTQIYMHTSQIFMLNLRRETCKQEITEAFTYFSRITRLSVCVVLLFANHDSFKQKAWLIKHTEERMFLFLTPIFVFPQSFSHYFSPLIPFSPYSSFSFSCLLHESLELAKN